MLKAVKVKIYPNKDQEIIFAKLFGCYRKVYNLCLSHKMEAYENSKTSLGLKELGYYYHNILTKSDDFFYLNEHNTKVLKQSIINMLVAYKNFFESLNGTRKGDNVGFPKFRSKYDDQSVRFPLEAISKRFFSEDFNKINITKQIKNLKFRCSDADKKYLIKYKDNIKSLTIKKSKAGTYTASILVDGSPINEFRKNAKDYENVNDKIIGIDLGIKSYYVSYDGENRDELENPKFLRSKEHKLKRLQRKLSRLDNKNKELNNTKETIYSNNRNKLRKRLAKQYEKITRSRETFLHQETSKLINENQVIVIEDLYIKGMIKNHKLAKSIQELCLGKFKQLLLYKAEWYNRKIVMVDRFYPSSKLCSCCGYKKVDLTLKDRTYECPECGLVIDRDYNASINIRQEGLRILTTQ